MRIAVFCPTVSGFGGMETAITNLMAGFAALGDQAHLFLFGGSADEGWLQSVSHTSYGSPKSSRYVRLLKYAYAPALSIARWKPDAVLCADVTSLRMALAGRRLARRRSLPLASWIHFPLPEVRMKEHLHQADLHLAISNAFAGQLREFQPTAGERTFTVYNPLLLQEIQLLPRPETAEFLYIGRLSWDDHKRVNDLLTAAAALRGAWRLKIIGAPSKDRAADEPRLKAYAEQLGISDRVEWLGWQRDPWRAVHGASAMVVTSEREGFGMVLVEAMARGVPCISSQCGGGPAEIILQGRNGWFYPVADTARLAREMQRIVDDPSALPSREQVRETAFRYEAAAVAQRVKDAFLQVRGEALTESAKHV